MLACFSSFSLFLRVVSLAGGEGGSLLLHFTLFLTPQHITPAMDNYSSPTKSERLLSRIMTLEHHRLQLNDALREAGFAMCETNWVCEQRGSSGCQVEAFPTKRGTLRSLYTVTAASSPSHSRSSSDSSLEGSCSIDKASRRSKYSLQYHHNGFFREEAEQQGSATQDEEGNTNSVPTGVKDPVAYVGRPPPAEALRCQRLYQKVVELIVETVNAQEGVLAVLQASKAM